MVKFSVTIIWHLLYGTFVWIIYSLGVWNRPYVSPCVGIWLPASNPDAYLLVNFNFVYMLYSQWNQMIMTNLPICISLFPILSYAKKPKSRGFYWRMYYLLSMHDKSSLSKWCCLLKSLHIRYLQQKSGNVGRSSKHQHPKVRMLLYSCLGALRLSSQTRSLTEAHKLGVKPSHVTWGPVFGQTPIRASAE